MNPVPSFAFGRDRRLRKRADFLRVQGEGRRVTTRHFTLLVAARPVQAGGAGRGSAALVFPSRLGCVVSKKIGPAVARNRVKRLCRECFRLWPGLVPDGVDLVVIARPGAADLGLADVRAEWRNVESMLRKRAADALAFPQPE